MTQKKAEDNELIETYKKYKSCPKVAEVFGMSYKTVHGRLKKLGIDTSKESSWSEKEIAILTRFYTERAFCPSDKFNLQDLADMIGREKSNVSRKARSLGLTNINRRLSEDAKKEQSKKMKFWIEKNGHPKGMLGKNHSEQFKKEMSEKSKKMWVENEKFVSGQATFKSLKTKHKKGILRTERNNVTWKGKKRSINGKEIYFRSTWEANFARYLDASVSVGVIKSWEYEPDTFWFHKVQRGSRCYTPDFKIYSNDTYYYVEVKGWMDQKSKTKLKRMKKYYPEEQIVLVQRKEMKELDKLFGHLEGWEKTRY